MLLISMAAVSFPPSLSVLPFFLRIFSNEGGEVGGSCGKFGGGKRSPFFISSSCSYEG